MQSLSALERSHDKKGFVAGNANFRWFSWSQSDATCGESSRCVSDTQRSRMVRVRVRRAHTTKGNARDPMICYRVAIRGSHSAIFFFQAEDGIRDYKVTGVQTCALPI